MGGTLRRFRRRYVRFRRNETGFTLAELLISIAILGIISGVLAAAFLVSGKTTAQTTERFNESHDAQIASAYFATDVQGAQAITTESCAAKGQTSLVNFSAPQLPAAPPYPVISWFSGTATGTGGDQITRRTCTGPSEAELTSDAPVIYHPVVSGPNAPVVSCDGASCNPAAPPPTMVTITIHDRNRVDETEDFVYALTGSRRAQAGTAAGSGAIATRSSLIALGPLASDQSTVSGAQVTVNNSIAVNSSLTHGVGDLACLGIQFVGSFAGAGCNGGPSSQIAGPPHDPFALLPRCPAAVGCPSAIGPGVDLPDGNPPGPGVYHNVTINTPVTFPPGIYVITGLLDVQPGADGLDLAGVTLYFACTDYGSPTSCELGSQGGSFNFGQGSDPFTLATVNLSPVLSGEYAATTQSPGVSIFVDPQNPASSSFTSGTRVSGAVYAAGAKITVNGGGTFKGGIVSRSFDVVGGAETIDIGG